MGEQREIRAALVGAIAVTAYMALVLASGRVGLPEFGRLLLFRTLPQDFLSLGARSRYPLFPFFRIIGQRAGSWSVSSRLVLRFSRTLNHNCTT